MLLLIYCLLIMAVSVLGGWIPMLIKLTHRRVQFALSFVSGVIFGIGVLDLLPHALMAQFEATPLAADAHAHGGLSHQAVDPVLLWLLAGFLTMFLIERFFCFHHHEFSDDGHARDCAHDHDHVHPAPEAGRAAHRMGWIGAAIGLTLHSLIAGVALAASTAHGGDITDANAFNWAGFGTFLIIVLHKPFDALTLGALLALRERSGVLRHLVNFLFSLAVPLGAGLFVIGFASGGETGGTVAAAALAFAAGAFICIALADLLPELQFHHHDRLGLSLALIAGLALAWGVTKIESGHHDHSHDHGHDHALVESADGHDHSHDGHDHDHDHDGHDHRHDGHDHDHDHDH